MSAPGDPPSDDLTESPPYSLAPLRQQFGTALRSVLLLTLATGTAFPLGLGALARLFFPFRTNGSLISRHGMVIGADLIGQNFTGSGYFHPRPSAAGNGYDAMASGGTNLGPRNPKLRDGALGAPTGEDQPFLGVRQLVHDYRRQNETPSEIAIPIDAVTRSGSGLDPHISPANAALQVPRIARVRNLSEEQVRRLVAAHTEERQLGFMGEPRVSVLALNLALDRLAPLPSTPSARR